jgi:hypothetical protein
MNHTLTISFALIVGFFIGVGSTFVATQEVISFQAKKVASLTEAHYVKQAECEQLVSELTRGKRK